MKKLLLFLALWSGVAGAMQSDVADLNSAKQDQINQAVATAIAEQASKLTASEQQQAVAQAAKNVKEIVDACGNDKELLKTTLAQRIKNLIKEVFVDDTNYFVVHAMRIWESSFYIFVLSCELVLVVTVLYSCIYGISLLGALALGEKVLLASSPAQIYSSMLANFMHFGAHFGRWIFTDCARIIATGSAWIALPILLSTFTLSHKIVANLFPERPASKEASEEATDAEAVIA